MEILAFLVLGGIAGVGEALVGGAVVGFVETGERVEGAFDERPAEVERERGGLGEGARGEVEGGQGGIFDFGC